MWTPKHIEHDTVLPKSLGMIYVLQRIFVVLELLHGKSSVVLKWILVYVVVTRQTKASKSNEHLLTHPTTTTSTI